VRSVFDPRISFGGNIQVATGLEALQKANGTWTVYKLDLALDSQVPRGKWECSMYGYNPGSPSPILPPP
jgi:hypothetical protein